MRHLFLILLMTLAALSTPAQTHYKGKISVGGKAGATFSRVNFNPTVEQSMLPGMTAGVMFRYVEENHFGLVAELNLSVICLEVGSSTARTFTSLWFDRPNSPVDSSLFLESTPKSKIVVIFFLYW